MNFLRSFGLVLWHLFPLIILTGLSTKGAEIWTGGKCQNLLDTQRCELRSFWQIDSPLMKGNNLKDRKVTLNFDWIAVPTNPVKVTDHLVFDMSEVESKYALENLKPELPLRVSMFGTPDQLLSGLKSDTIHIPIGGGQGIGLKSGMEIQLYPIYENGESAENRNAKIKKFCKISESKRKLLAVLDFPEGEDSQEEISELEKPKMLVMEKDKALVCCITTVHQVNFFPVLLANNQDGPGNP